MSSLLSTSQKNSLIADFQNVINTFVRTLIVYQEAQKMVIISDPNYNPYESNNQNQTEIKNTPNFTVIQGRILYDKDQEWSFAFPYGRRSTEGVQLKVKDQIIRSVRVKVDATGNQLLQTAKKVEIDGLEFNLESVARPHGLFGAEYYTYYFTRSM